MPRCAIGLGGNLGDVAAAFAAALRRLDQSNCPVVAVSRLYVTRAVGPQAGDDFRNACALIDTTLPPNDLLGRLHEIEDAAGRTRTVRWGSRSLDLDILTYGDLVQDDSELTLPHPGLVYRRFVLDPLAEIAPDLVHPVLGRSVGELRQRLCQRPLRLVLWGQSESTQRRIRTLLLARFAGIVHLDEVLVIGRDGGEFVIDLDPLGIAGQCPPSEFFVAQVDPKILDDDPAEATIAVVTAMLDEPLPGAELDSPHR